MINKFGERLINLYFAQGPNFRECAADPGHTFPCISLCVCLIVCELCLITGALWRLLFVMCDLGIMLI